MEENSEGFSGYYPFEVFISPPTKNNNLFGDILYYHLNYYITLSPACDMAQAKYEKIIIAQMEPLDTITAFIDFSRLILFHLLLKLP